MSEIIGLANEEVKKLGGTLAGIGIGSPGRFNDGVIKPGTSLNMGTTPNEFDGVNLHQKFTDALSQTSVASVPLYVGNDGDAMLAGIIDSIQSKDPKLKDQNGDDIGRFAIRKKHVALLGIGTGVGHAIASIDSSGAKQFVTDGHASKLRVKLDDADWEQLLKVKEIINNG